MQQPLTSPFLDLFLELCAIPSPSGQERAVADRVRKCLEELGLAVEEDDAAERLGGTAGNLLSRLPATEDGLPIFFCAHTDTVPPEAAIEPVVLTRGEKTITGTYYGSAHPRQDMPRIADWYARGLLDIDSLVTRRYPLSEINRAYEDIETDAVGRGVLVF